MTKKEMLETIKDMPEDAEIQIEIDLWEYRLANSISCNKDDNTIIISMYY